jgi:hypothetical protein
MDPQQIPLRDLHLPPPIDWWPLAPGWWILVSVVLLGLLYMLRRAYRAWRANRPRRIALRELQKVNVNYQRGADAIWLSQQLSQLLRRAMLAYAPRSEVGGLAGQRWLEWLDRGLDGKPFTAGPGRLLETLPYRQHDERDAELDVQALIETVRLRLSTPLPGAGA